MENLFWPSGVQSSSVWLSNMSFPSVVVWPMRVRVVSLASSYLFGSAKAGSCLRVLVKKGAAVERVPRVRRSIRVFSESLDSGTGIGANVSSMSSACIAKIPAMVPRASQYP